MVKKLFKHEIKYYIRSLTPVYIVLLGIAVMGRILECFEAQTTSYSILRGSSVFALVVGILATVGLTLAFAIIRYYKNMFSGEGYLTLTLPVTSGQHLFVKLGTALLAMLCSFVVSVLAVCVFTVGDWLRELVKAGVYIFRESFVPEFGVHLPFLIAEFIVAVICAVIAEILLYYMCISLGQLFRKNRVLAAVGVYFGLYMIFQVLATVVSIVMAIFLSDQIDAIERWIQMYTPIAAHIILGICLLGNIIASLIYLLISRYVLTKRLNLE